QVDEATDRDGDGYAGDDPDPARVDCDDDNPRVHPFRGEIPCNDVDEDCVGGDRCVMGDLDGDGVSAPEDCDDHDAGSFPGAPERCGDGIDQDCQGGDMPCAPGDTDQDGFVDGDDCGEGDASRYPGAPEKCGDGIDQDCDGADMPCGGADGDGDGYLAPADCADDDPRVGPGAVELCDRVDNDCDGRVDEGNPLQLPGGPLMPPTCGTDVGICQTGPHVCSRAEGAAGAEILCLAIPPAEEVCDGLDNDCDGTVDQPPAGQDRLADEGVEPCGPEREVGACRRGPLYCAQGSLSACRGAVEGLDESCNSQDDDCDGRIDEGEGGGALTEPCFDGDPAAASQGICREGQRRCEDGAFTACEGQLLPAEEGCNDLDDDCDGQVDEGLAQACYTFDPATENVGRCRGGARQCVNGQFGDCEGQVGPSPELCNDRDDDCDGRIDQFTEDCFGEAGQGLDPALIGRGLCEAGFRTCRDGVVGECVGDILPEAEICDRLDNDCDGSADEDFDFVNDPANCRECGRRCNAGEGCCASACRPLNTPENCGACGRTCGDDSDRCAAGAGGAECRCGNGPACEDGLRCINGSCRCVENTDCGANELCCDGVCQATDPGVQCQACGVACPDGRANDCRDRTCSCGAGGACPPATVCTQDAGQGPFLCRGCGSNAQCPADAICCGGVCTPSSAAGNCTGCGVGCDPDVADFCQGAEESVARSCVCGQNGVACPDPLVCVFGRNAGEGRCAECRNDADCGASFPGRPRCVDNVCRACNPRDQAPCGNNQICCGFQCVATGAGPGASCEQCGVSCAQEPTNVCTGRTCGCGNGPPCVAGSATPLCDDPRGVCVQCRTDVDCAGNPAGGQCVNNRCEACDPGDQAGCLRTQLCCNAGGRPVCQEANINARQCESCNNDCDPLATNRCNQRVCQCGNNPPCAGGTPVCDDAAGACVECTTDAHCNGHARGSQCVANRCQPCDPADHAGCGANQLCCGDLAAPSCQATGAGAGQQCESCGVACDPTAAADRCTNRSCACGNGADCGGATPYCVGAGCFECRNNNDCPANELCCGGTCEPTGGGANEQCEACDVACDQEASNRCGNRRCSCGNDAACAGDRPICREDAQGRALGCVQCLADADCADFPGHQCVDFSAAPATPPITRAATRRPRPPSATRPTRPAAAAGATRSAPPARVPATSASAAGASAAIRRTTRAARPSRPSATP
ncbi:MAG: MopE-related protein, partial [bacterium]